MRKKIPNILSLSRIFLLVPLVICIKNDDILLIIILSLAMLVSDFFDGLLARRWNAASAAGRVLDPLADKICIATVGVALVILRNFPMSLLVALVLRDILILIAGAFLIKISGEIPVSDIPGKISVNVFAASLLVFLFKVNFLKTPVVYAAWLFIIISLISYARTFYYLLKK